MQYLKASARPLAARSRPCLPPWRSALPLRGRGCLARRM